ncbi:MAG: MFS transporter, partial [Haliea sp.]|nr:MFS transporter [Haliea sp.]
VLHLLVILAVTNILTAMYLGPCIALSHALVPPNMRAFTSAILFFVLNMIGLGLGPFLIGLTSDLLAPRFGTDSLRYAMVIASCFGLVAIGLFYFGARQLPADLEKRRRSAETFSVV